MRIGWSIPLPGPFRVSGTVWRSRSRRRPGYHGQLPGWKCPHNHSRPDLAVACANRYARSPEYQAQQAARARQAAEREARQQARAAERKTAQLRARLDRCIALAAAEAVAAVTEHGGTLPGKRSQRKSLAGAAGQIIRRELFTAELGTEDMAGLDTAAQAVASASSGPVLAAVTEHGGTLPPEGERGLTEHAVRQAIRQQIVAGFPRENLADGGGSPDPGQDPRPQRSRRQRRGARVIGGGVVLALTILLISLLAGQPGSSTLTAAPSPAVTAPATEAPATEAPAPAYDVTQGCTDLSVWLVTNPATADSPKIQAIATRAAGTKFGADLATWLGDLRGGLAGTDTAMNDAASVHADCAAHGIDVLQLPAGTQPASTPTQTPAGTQAPETQAPATQAPAPAETQAPAAAGTHRAGEFCGEHGMTDAAGLTCTLYPSGTWHWKR